MSNEAYHTTVLLHEAIEALDIDPNGTYVDATFGGGGHSFEILKKLDRGKLLVFDQDESARDNLIDDDRLVFIPENFRFMSNFLAFHGVSKVHGVLADLGVSGHQFDNRERGFSFHGDAPLDMRMSRSQGVSAKELIGKMSLEELVKMLKTNSDIPKAYGVAKSLLNAHASNELNTTADLVKCLEPLAPKFKEHKFYAQVFQAIRIEVNDELGALKDLLKQSPALLIPGGRLVLISYHSLEDRLVKNFLRSGNFTNDQEKDFYGNLIRPFDPVSSKALIPSKEEIDRNTRARSAKMRTGTRNG
ncbi:MAG: 16S rRNA (cytosine(1402)-N(4))-methyltransferase RsmH [Flavobacteriales bacterium]|nr:16S rRNA (cytosine(1402)-N(4))-methyltransferase RsmH [Flavobacteriales bacterium]